MPKRICKKVTHLFHVLLFARRKIQHLIGILQQHSPLRLRLRDINAACVYGHLRLGREIWEGFEASLKEWDSEEQKSTVSVTGES